MECRLQQLGLIDRIEGKLICHRMDLLGGEKRGHIFSRNVQEIRHFQTIILQYQSSNFDRNEYKIISIIEPSFIIPYFSMKNPRDHFSKLRPKQISGLPVLSLSYNNKEQLRCLITDYVLHNIESEGKMAQLHKFKAKKIKYPSFPLKVNINNEQKQLALDFGTILRKYIEFEKKNMYRDQRIQPLVVDILNFLDQIEERTANIIFQIETQNLKKIEDELLNLIIQKHHKDKQKKNQNIEIDAMKKKIVAKHTRISYIDIEDQLKKKEKEFLLEINDFDGHNSIFANRNPHQVIVPTSINQCNDSLMNLIETGIIFEDSQKIKQIKKEKIIKFYRSNELEYLNNLSEIKEEINNQFPGENISESANFLKSWIADITLSENFYKNKFQKQEKKKITEDMLEKNILVQEQADD